MTHLQSIPPPRCLCQHGAEHHVLTDSGGVACGRPWCACSKYVPDNDRYPEGLIPTS